MDDPAEQRLQALRGALTTPSARLRDTPGHLAGRALCYLKEHPATVVVTALSVVIALGTGNILPLSSGVLSALTGIRDIFKGLKRNQQPAISACPSGGPSDRSSTRHGLTTSPTPRSTATFPAPPCS